MTGYGHAIIGTSTTFAALAYSGLATEVPHLVGGVAVGLVGSLLPDVDTEHSLLTSKILGRGNPKITHTIFSRRSGAGEILSVFVGAVEMVIRLSIYVLIMPVSVLVRHRRLTHYLLSAGVLAAVLFGVADHFSWPLAYPTGFTIGYLSHLFADSTTKAGVPLLGPFFKRRWHLLPKSLRIRTTRGMSLGEVTIVGLVTLSSLVWAYWATESFVNLTERF